MNFRPFPALISLALLSLAARSDDLDGILSAVARYESGLDIAPLRQVENMIVRSVDDADLRKKIETRLARALTGTSSFEGKRFICQQLALIGGEECLPALTSLLDNPETAGIACLALAQNPAPATDEILRSVTARLSGIPLVQVVHAIGVRRDSKAVSQLARVAENNDEAATGAALVALGRIATPAALETLSMIRQKQSPALAADANEATMLAASHLVASGDLSAAQKLYEKLVESGVQSQVRRGAFEALVRLDPDGGQQRAAGTMASNESLLKRSAIASVATMKGKGISKRFAAVMTSLQPEEQALLIQALAARGDADARVAIHERVATPILAVRMAAIHALGQAGDTYSVAVLANSLRGKPTTEELKAIESALSSLPLDDAVDAAIARELANRTEDSRLALLAALVRRANRSSLPALKIEAASSDPKMARLAFLGLSRVVTADDLPVLLKALISLRATGVREEVESAVAQAMNRMGKGPRQSAAVRAAIGQSLSVDARASLLRLLAACPDRDGLSAVTASLSETNQTIKEAAIRTLAEWPDITAWESLVAVYLQTDVETHRVVALRGLVRLLGEQNAKPTANSIERYQAVLAKSKSDSDRKLILGALADCAHPEALKIAVAHLSDTSVRAEAEAAVKRIAHALKSQHPE